jgi:hypothetical protein
MKLSLISIASVAALSMVAGCASSPRPTPAAPTQSPAPTPDWVAAAAATGSQSDFQFTPVTSSKAKAPGDTEQPATALKVDNASGSDVKHTHLKAAAH